MVLQFGIGQQLKFLNMIQPYRPIEQHFWLRVALHMYKADYKNRKKETI